MAPKIRVFLLAGNRLLREALGRILRKGPDVFVSGEASHPASPEPILQSKADVVLMDGGAAGAANLEFVSTLSRSYPSVQIVLIGMNESEPLFFDAVQAGVTGFLLKDASAKDVIAAIRSVSQGEAVCPPRLCRALFRRVASGELCVASPAATRESRLTRRQIELVPMIAKGLTNKEIASHLNLSEQTVKNHIHRMLQKVGAEDRLQVVEKAISSALWVS